jgi:threonyl-tRNA synthetase
LIEPFAGNVPPSRCSVLGNEDAESHSVSIRRLGSKGQGELPTNEALAAPVEAATPTDVKRLA